MHWGGAEKGKVVIKITEKDVNPRAYTHLISRGHHI
jgi:hypothetical protein